MADALLTSPQVALRLGCSVRTVHRLVAGGDLAPAQKLPGPNGAFLFAEDDVERLNAYRPLTRPGRVMSPGGLAPASP